MTPWAHRKHKINIEFPRFLFILYELSSLLSYSPTDNVAYLESLFSEKVFCLIGVSETHLACLHLKVSFLTHQKWLDKPREKAGYVAYTERG